ncbi:HAD-IIB family hydrolase [Calothrix sp. NIES-3974]|uniref:HAD-IIB family hydrolase n=1 Tax=Calothrix sp. NIES-3974 TaxID=2005462 RepID=UPI000B5E5CB1|nr:HAD family hydrolase [Calothrix sp. NIES-3974]BAZ04947.1 hypothetical protein NIES3974_15930 [Calothrix sp. NIES-3974]
MSNLLSENTTLPIWSQIRLIATDMDGTLTTAGKFTRELMQAFYNLNAAGIKVIIVTGRSAGWVSGIAHYLPIDGAIAENGGLFYAANSDIPVFLTEIEDIQAHRQQLGDVFRQIQRQFPQIQESADNRFRITDWTFDVAKLTPGQLQHIQAICLELGWGFTYSTVQCHIKPLMQDKARGLLTVMNHHLERVYTPQKVITVGDSPNDETLFNQEKFPNSVGVANVMEYTYLLQHQPTYITNNSEGTGFCELADLICFRAANP